MNIDEIRELILLFDQTEISELEIQKDDCKLSLRKAIGEKGQVEKASPVVSNVASLPSKEEPVKAENNENIIEVTSPMVATFYRAPSPDSSPYVEIGDHVDEGQVLCILEAMKLMNEIKSEVSGTIIDILVENTEPVEYGQVLFLIEKD